MRAIYSPLALIISAVLTGLAQQPLQMGWLAWFSLIPLLFVLNRITSLKHFVITGFIWGCTYYLTVIFWLANNLGTTFVFGLLSLVIAVLFCSLNIIIICVLMKIVNNCYQKNWYWSFPFIWTGVEYIRNLDILSGGPWTALANTQIDFLTLAQNVEITGIYGITFWLVFINTLIYHWMIHPYPENSFAAITVFIFPWISGLWLTPQVQTDSSSLDVAVVQPNIHQTEKWRPGRATSHILSLLNQSKLAIENDVELVIWPESATSSYLLQGGDFNLKWIQSKLKNSTLISGIVYYKDEENQRKYYNSAALIEADTVKAVYHKLRLVPVGEYIPLSNHFSVLNNIDLGQGDYTSGTDYVIMEINNVKCAVMICFESTLPSLSRQFVNDDAEVLIYLVNDGWYENPPQPQQHAKQVVYRAIENRRPVIRCTNTGISMIVDHSGNISHELPLNEKGIIQTTIKPQNIATFYTCHGDIFAKLSVLVSLLLIFGGLIRKK